MRCKDVQKHLSIEAQPSRLSGRIRAHLLGCAYCRQAQAVYAGIDDELREQPAWQPPPGFAERVGLQGLASLGEVPARSRGTLSQIVGPIGATPSAPIALGLITAMLGLLILPNANILVTGYQELISTYSKVLVANATQLSWVTGILALCFSAWVTRRALQ